MTSFMKIKILFLEYDTNFVFMQYYHLIWLIFLCHTLKTILCKVMTIYIKLLIFTKDYDVDFD